MIARSVGYTTAFYNRQRRFLCIRLLFSLFFIFFLANANGQTHSTKPEIIQSNPNASVATLISQSKVLSAKREFSQAINLLQQALVLNPNSADIKISIARNLTWQGNYKAAEDLLTLLAEQYPANPDVELAQGYLYYYQGDLNTARGLFKVVLQEVPNYSDAIQGLAQVEKQSKALPKTTHPSSATLPTKTEQIIRSSQKLSAQQRYIEAIKLLQQAEKLDPNNVEVKLQIARNLSWQKNYLAANRILNQLAHSNPQNLDIKLAQGYLLFYRQDLSHSKQVFQQILRADPNYADAHLGLQLVDKAEKAQPLNPIINSYTDSELAKAIRIQHKNEFNWRLDSGFEYSQFSRQPQPSWNQEFLILTRFYNQGATAIHGGTTRYFEYQQEDIQYEVGVDHRFNRRFYTYLYSYATPNAVYRPDWGLSGGLGIRLNDPNARNMPLWLTLDAKNDKYPITGYAQTINPGLRLEPADNWAVIVKEITVKQGMTSYGGLLQLNGQIKSGLQFNLGYADAPEIQNNVAVRTKTIFSGLAVDLTRALTLHFEYTHDDRENSWIRGAYFGSFTYRF